ncbi:MAG: NACHT domain-containing protein [Rhodospirillaceae bacterium]|nr:NACHT domain-containing protein [Rhodospirillaceae bacterium]
MDWSPDLWHAFPELFPGRVPPPLARAAKSPAEGLSRIFRLAVTSQHARDRTVKFRQVKLQQQLLDLFVDLDVAFHVDDDFLRLSMAKRFRQQRVHATVGIRSLNIAGAGGQPPTALQLLIDDDLGVRRILLEGGPGQGKSTVTQMAAQIYREKLLGEEESLARDRSWHQLCRLRLPIRVELKEFALWLADTPDGALEEYIAHVIARDSGGVSVTVNDVQAFIERSPVILLLDGLDEIGNDSTRDKALDKIMATVTRWENALKADLRVVLTTRPPAVVGRRQRLDGFARAVLTPMRPKRIDEYLRRWLSVQIDTREEQHRITASFDGRRHEPHVDALARNPMQLSVLLQFIYLKADAFPDHRADLYREYFQIVIDRDVEKSPELREARKLIEGLHAFLGFRIHGMTEIDDTRRSLNREEIVRLAGSWLSKIGHSSELAERYFALGEERFGLIVAQSGEGHETTYGFEVQPIQEYFAAAYISDHLPDTPDANAHDVFELLIPRSYWREVALFLAGLRRPNEKADLVGRAKLVDSDLANGSQSSNGREIVLQLLREGVFNERIHVLTEAMSVAMELLDLESLRLHRAPDDLVASLAELGKLYGDGSIHRRVEKMARDHIRSDDHRLLALIHKLAAAVLPRARYTNLVLQYTGTVPEARSVVRLKTPYKFPSAFARLAARDGYWEGLPVPLLARDLWRSAMERSNAVHVPFPSGMHFNLVVQFAIDYWTDTDDQGDSLDIQGAHPFAIWKLKHDVHTIRGWLTNQEEGGAAVVDPRPGLEVSRWSWDDGGGRPLPREVEDCLRDLVEASSAVVSAMGERSEATIAAALVDYMSTIRRHLADPGIAGWMAARCAIDVIEGRTAPPLRRFRRVGNAIDDTRRSLLELFNVHDVYSSGMWYVHDLSLLGMPLALRLKHGEKPRRFEQVIADVVRGDLDPEERRYCSWIRNIPLPGAVIRPLVDLFDTDIPRLLRFVRGRGVAGALAGPRLKVQDTQRILAICRRTDDVDTLRGASTLLVQATFDRIAEPDLVVKLISAAPSSPLVWRVLNVTGWRSQEGRVSPSEKELARTVARRILDNPEGHPFHVANQAATCVREGEARSRTPLFEKRPELLGFVT